MYAVGKQAEASGRGEYRKYLDAFKFQTIQFEAQQQQRAFQNAMSMAQMAQQQSQFGQQMAQQQAALQQRGTQFNQQQAYNQQLLQQKGDQFDKDFGLRQKTGQSMIDWRKKQGDALILKQSTATAKLQHDNGATSRWLWKELRQDGAERHALRSFKDYDDFHEWFTIQPEEVQESYRNTFATWAKDSAEAALRISSGAKLREAMNLTAQRRHRAQAAEAYFSKGKAALDAARDNGHIDHSPGPTGWGGIPLSGPGSLQRESEYDQKLNYLKQRAMRMAETGEGLPPFLGGPQTQNTIMEQGVTIDGITWLKNEKGIIDGKAKIPTPTLRAKTIDWFYGDHGPVKKAEAAIASDDSLYEKWLAGVKEYKTAFNAKKIKEVEGETELGILLPTIPPSPWGWDHSETVRRIESGMDAEPRDWRKTVPGLDDNWPKYNMTYRQAFRFNDENQHFPERSTRPQRKPAADETPPGGPGVPLSPEERSWIDQNVLPRRPSQGRPWESPLGGQRQSVPDDPFVPQQQDRRYVPGFPGGNLPFRIPPETIDRWQRVIGNEARKISGGGDQSRPNYQKLDGMFDQMSQRATGKNSQFVKLLNSWWKTAVRQQSSTGFNPQYQRDLVFAKRGELALEGLKSLDALLKKFPDGMQAEHGNDPVFVRWISVLEQAKSLLPPPSKKTPPPQTERALPSRGGGHYLPNLPPSMQH